VASFRDVDQFQPGHTAYACGCFAVAVCKAMAPPGKTPTARPADMAMEAEDWYKQDNGDNSHANQEGMSLAQLTARLTQVGLRWRTLDLDVGEARAWVGRGYPVIVSCPETSIHDLGLGDKVPYPWKPFGNHIITLTGVGPGGSLLARDTANIEAPNTLRPGPRLYDADKLQLVSATLVVPPWMPAPFAEDIRRQLLGGPRTRVARIGGWTPAQVSPQFTTHDFDVTRRITGPGVYALLLDYEGGADALATSEAALLSGDRQLARDAHDGWTGVENHGRVYHLALTTYDLSARYTVRVRLRSAGGTDSRGVLYFADPDPESPQTGQESRTRRAN
jgi:hypothetical protein